MEEKNPNILYHYCSADTFYEIIKSKSLRLSDITKSNDSQELKWVFTRFKEDFSLSYLYKYGRENNVEVYKKVLEYADGIFQNSYVCCFSKDRDSLSQWRGYAADGTGLSLGIDASSIYYTSTSSIKLLKVEYDENTQKDFIAQNVAKLVSRDIGEITDQVIFDVLFELLEKATQYKHHSFYTENEYRFIYTTSLGKGSLSYYYEKRSEANKNTNLAKKEEKPSIKSYIDLCLNQGFSSEGLTLSPLSIRKDNLVSYYDLGFRRIKDTFIREVIIGPKCKLDRDDILLFLHALGYDLDAMIDKGFSISKSDSTYT